MLGESVVIPGMVKRKRLKTTPAQIIFFRMYPIVISGIHLIDEESLERFGTVTTGRTADDLAMAAAPRAAQVTIAGMAHFLAEGANFQLTDKAAANEIFTVIQDHLMNWLREIDRSFNVVTAPVEGLRQLEALAEYLYPYAMRERNATREESHLHRSLKDLIRNRSRFRPSETKGVEEKKRRVDEVIEPYNPRLDDLTRELEKREAGWK